MANIKDVAQVAEVSPSTVSHVMNGTRVVAEETRLRVERAIRELNYIPNGIARSLKGISSRVLGMLVTDSTNPFYANLIQRVERAAYEKGYNLILCNTHGDPQCAKDHLETLIRRRIDGLLVMSAEAPLDGMEPIRQFAELPVVVMDWGPHEDMFDRLQDDSCLGAYLATRHLLDNGHRNIACLLGPIEKSNTKLRLQGYTKALAEQGIEVNKQWVVKSRYSCSGGYEAMQHVLATERPTAVFAGNDLMAMGAIRAASEAGLSVPEDLSIVGYDDIPQSAYLVPGLTTIRQPVEKLADKAIDMLLERIKSPDVPGRVIKIKPILTERDSVKRISHSN